MEWMLLPLKRYADFEGRSQRMEYWMFQLGIFAVVMVWAIIFAVFGGLSEGGGMNALATIWAVLGGIAMLGLIVPSIAVTVRRFHDQDKSGWFYLLSFIPYVGGIVVFVFMCIEGTRGPNRFGEDPKNPGGVATYFE